MAVSFGRCPSDLQRLFSFFVNKKIFLLRWRYRCWKQKIDTRWRHVGRRDNPVSFRFTEFFFYRVFLWWFGSPKRKTEPMNYRVNRVSRTVFFFKNKNDEFQNQNQSKQRKPLANKKRDGSFYRVVPSFFHLLPVYRRTRRWRPGQSEINRVDSVKRKRIVALLDVEITFWGPPSSSLKD